MVQNFPSDPVEYRYSFCDNNPVSKKDPNGRSAIAVLTAFAIKNAPRLIGAAVGAGSYIVSTLIQGEEVKLTGIAASVLLGATFNLFLGVTIDATYEAYATIMKD